MDTFYTGSCRDLSDRMTQHLQNEYRNSFTSITQDWQLFYSIDGLEYQQARHIESHIKKMKSRTYLQNLKKHPEMMEKLKQRFIQES